MGAKPDFAIPLSIVGIGLAIALPRLLQNTPMSGTDWLLVVAGLGAVAFVCATFFRTFFKR